MSTFINQELTVLSFMQPPRRMELLRSLTGLAVELMVFLFMIIDFRKTFSNLGDPGDIPIPKDEPVSIIWAIGKMAEVRHRVKEPSFHHTYTRKHTQIGEIRKKFPLALARFLTFGFVWPKKGNNCTFFIINLQLTDFTSKDKVNTCFALTSNRKETDTPWFINPIFNPSKRSFSARLGPAGGKKGYR